MPAQNVLCLRPLARGAFAFLSLIIPAIVAGIFLFVVIISIDMLKRL